ncbi:MAG: glycosyltransferase [Actinomycetota bacterium]|nr:glycosyltransferase [Actinomycetota bacterium]
MALGRFDTAVCIPCHNEERTVGTVVSAFRSVLPEAVVYVYDNDSSDRTSVVAAAAGAQVRHVAMRGKGHVVRRMLADIEADAYLLVDGDGTYDASVASEMVDLVRFGGNDLVNAGRDAPDGGFPPGHSWGNRALTGLVQFLFDRRATDMLSGYKALSRRFAKSFPVFSNGFEIETELTVHALRLQMPIADLSCPYAARPAGSTSKLRTYSDGWRILRTILRMWRQERPLAFFSAVGAIFALSAIGLALPLLPTYFQTGLVPRLPTALLATALMLIAFLNLTCGLILDTVTQGRKEAKLLRYLAVAGPLEAAAPPMESPIERRERRGSPEKF